MKRQLEKIRIETPEKIVFSYRIAGVGARMAAYILDSLIRGLVIFLLVLLFVASSTADFELETILSDGTGHWFTVAFIFLIVFFLQWGYYLFFEIVWCGRSPGKAILKIRVIHSGGQPLDFSTLAIRNLVRAVDNFPVFCLLGGVVALTDKYSRRLGDILGDTLVVHDILFNLKEPDFSTVFISPWNGPPDGRSLVNNEKLTENQLMILRKFLNGKDKLSRERQEELAAKLAAEVMQHLKIRREILDPLSFLERIYREHGEKE